MQKQASVIKNRSCGEKVQVEDKSVYLNFIDFRKAFDSVHGDTPWTILRPVKTIDIRNFYTVAPYESADHLENGLMNIGINPDIHRKDA